jgi:hypothetical protein
MQGTILTAILFAGVFMMVFLSAYILDKRSPRKPRKLPTYFVPEKYPTHTGNFPDTRRDPYSNKEAK